MFERNLYILVYFNRCEKLRRTSKKLQIPYNVFDDTRIDATYCTKKSRMCRCRTRFLRAHVKSFSLLFRLRSVNNRRTCTRCSYEFFGEVSLRPFTRNIKSHRLRSRIKVVRDRVYSYRDESEPPVCCHTIRVL